MRKFFAELGSGSGALAAAMVCLVLLAVGYYVQSGRDVIGMPKDTGVVSSSEKPAPVVAAPTSSQTDIGDAPSVPVAVATTEPAADTEPARSQKPTVATTEPEIPEITAENAPVFEEVRRDADGVTVIAGRASPGADVSVLQNGNVIATAKADGSGKFATLAMIPPDGRGHVLSLLELVAGLETASESEIILAPTVPIEPAVVATAQPDPEAPAGEAAGKVAALAQVPDKAETGDPVETGDAVETGTSAGPVGALTAKNEGPASVPVADGSAPAVVTTTTVATASAKSDETSAQLIASAEPDQAAAQKNAEQVVPSPDVPVEEKLAEPSTVAVLKSTATGVELLNTPQPDAMTTVALDTISYSEVGEVQLAGRAQTNTASVRVYLDNTSVINLPVDSQGRWRGELPDVDEGIYTLRVDEVSDGGKVTSRVETPFKRESAKVLLAAAAEQDGPISAITVQEGATLWAIARDRYGDGALYVRVFEANSKAIRDPDLIYPGQVFDLPD
ncbi:MAG: peptigoglycan-binding protein LysM [Sulfitobacter sp.]